jgi:hypothetical protein
VDRSGLDVGAHGVQHEEAHVMPACVDREQRGVALLDQPANRGEPPVNVKAVVEVAARERFATVLVLADPVPEAVHVVDADSAEGEGANGRNRRGLIAQLLCETFPVHDRIDQRLGGDRLDARDNVVDAVPG